MSYKEWLEKNPNGMPKQYIEACKENNWRANLGDADLLGADLRGAYLEGAYLEGAYLEGAYLEGADLRGAYLEGAYLEGADLRGADLTGATIDYPLAMTTYSGDLAFRLRDGVFYLKAGCYEANVPEFIGRVKEHTKLDNRQRAQIFARALSLALGAHGGKMLGSKRDVQMLLWALMKAFISAGLRGE